jgi:hypothetical protein
MPPLNSITALVIHCADTPNGVDLYDATDIDRWHKERGFVRDKSRTGALRHIGYHGVITIDGTWQPGRDWDEIGAHARGHNAYTWGVCLIGLDAFTVEQWSTLKRVAMDRMATAPGRIRVLGHREFNPGKSCPGFEVLDWLAGGMEPLAGHICDARGASTIA